MKARGYGISQALTWGLCSLALSLAGLCSETSAAQTVGEVGATDGAGGTPAASAEVAAGPGLEEIVVTAQKKSKSEDVQHAAISITALTPDKLEDLGIKDAYDMQTLLPGVRFQESDTTVPVIRGVGTFATNAGVDPAIAYSIDGIYLSHYQAIPPVLFDVARIEAVRGPQGTLYGRNANGGVINFITNDPVDHFEANAEFQFGNKGEIGSDAMVNVPVTEKIAIRASIGTDKHDPYLDGGAGDKDAKAARLKLLVRPFDDLKLLLSIDGSHEQNHNVNFSACPPHSDNPSCVGVPFRPFEGQGVYHPETHYNDNTFGITAEIDYTMHWATLTSLTGFRKFHLQDRASSPHNNFGYSDNEDDDFVTQEVRLASAPQSRLDWVAGLFYSHEDQRALTTYYGSFVPPGILNVRSAPFTSFYIPDGIYTSQAVFGDVTYPVVDGFRLKGGLRYTEEKKTATGIASEIANLVPYAIIPTGGEVTRNRLTWKAGAEVDLSSTSLLYATGSTGFKSGGINQFPLSSGLPERYSPETITAVEVGSKNRFLDGKLQVNVDAFHYDYSGYQTYTPFFTAQGLFFGIVNSQTAEFYGGEAEVAALVTPLDRLGLTLTLLHDKFGQFTIPAAGINATNNWVPNAPIDTIGVNYSHSFILKDASTLTVSADSQLVHGLYTDFTNNPGSYQSAYTRSNASLTYQTKNGDWKVSAYIRNIEGKGIISSWSAPIDIPQDSVLVYPPRTFGVTIKKNFH